MTTITIPINNELNEYIEDQVNLGVASSKAELVRLAIQSYKEEGFIKDVLAAQREIASGKGLTGDIDELAKGF